MTGEQAVLVAVRHDERVRDLIADILSAAQRSLKAEPGDRSDVVRYESLSVQLEAAVTAAMADGAPSVPVAFVDDVGAGLGFAAATVRDPIGPTLASRMGEPGAGVARRWVEEGHVVVLLRLPFVPTEHGSAQWPVRAPEPDLVWQAPAGASGRKAVEARFRAQLQMACERRDDPSRSAVNPSGVHNRVLTEILREYVDGNRALRTDAPIAYRDGSAAAHPFPLRCLPMVEHVPETPDHTLHLALLSIRHTDMDAVVDGAWLRNAEVSRPRPAAQTDDFVYGASLAQLRELTEHGRRTAVLRIYQTGLDTAVVGFYRAVTAHLLDYPGSLAVVPMFAVTASAGSGQDASFQPGRPWATKG